MSDTSTPPLPTLPATRQALVLTDLADGYQGCSVLSLPMPRPGPGQALVRIRAASIGFPDLLMTRGAYQHKPALPFVMGGDAAGEVVALGEGTDAAGEADGLAVGDAVVVAHQGGGFAEFAVYPLSALRRKPPGLSFELAASVGSAYLTAYVALVRRANLQPGEWVLVHGAAGGVGLAAVDLARQMGARVIATAASDEKLAVVAREYQPDAVLNVNHGFREQVKQLTGGLGADVVYDPVGGDVFDESTRCIAFDGRLLVIGFTSGRIPALTANIPLIKGFSVMGVRAGEYGRRFPDKGRENLDTVWRLAAEGQIRPRVHAALPLARWREAFAMMAERQLVGRVVITP